MRVLWTTAGLDSMSVFEMGDGGGRGGGGLGHGGRGEVTGKRSRDREIVGPAGVSCSGRAAIHGYPACCVFSFGRLVSTKAGPVLGPGPWSARGQGRVAMKSERKELTGQRP